MRVFALGPLALALATFAVLAALGLPAPAVDGATEVAKACAALGSLLAALAFDRGEYLRRAWLLSALSMVLLLVKDGLALLPLGSAGQALGLVCVVGCNVATVLSLWLMARIFHAVGLESDEATPRLGLTSVLALVVALAVTAPSFGLAFDGLARGEPRAFSWLASAVGDVLSLALVAPILLTALAMRGGLLVWPWALLTASVGAWLLYDIAGWFGQRGIVSAEHAAAIEALASCLASLYTAAAGLAQRRIIG